MFLGTCREGGDNSNSLNSFKQDRGAYENYRCRYVIVILDFITDDYFLARRCRDSSNIYQHVSQKWMGSLSRSLRRDIFPLRHKPRVLVSVDIATAGN